MNDYLTRRIVLLRHGQLATEPALVGQTDAVLSPHSLAQLRQWCRDLPPLLPWQRIVTSPLQRCREMATQLAAASGCACDVMPELAEMDFGELDGKPYDQITDAWPLLERFWADPATSTLPGAETLAAFNARVWGVWPKLLEMTRDHSLLIVTHGGVIRMLLAQLLHADWRIGGYYQQMQIPYASATDLAVWHYDGQIRTQLRQLAIPFESLLKQAG